MNMKNRITELERLNNLHRFDDIKIAERDTPPSRQELERLQRELAIPDDVFADLFGEQMRDTK